MWLLWRPLQTADPKPITLQRKALDLGEDYNTCKAVIAHQTQKNWKDTLGVGVVDCVASSSANGIDPANHQATTYAAN